MSIDDVTDNIYTFKHRMYTADSSLDATGSLIASTTLDVGNMNNFPDGVAAYQMIREDSSSNPVGKNKYAADRLMVARYDGGKIASKGSTVNFTINDICALVQTTGRTTNYISTLDVSKVLRVRLWVQDVDGEYHVVDSNYSTNSIKANGDTYYNISASFENVPVDTYGLIITFYYKGAEFFVDPSGSSWGFPDLRRTYGFGDYCRSTITVEDGTSGLLSNIIQLVKDVKNGVTNTVTAITELPSKIWGFIENGLKSLFVPDSDFIVGYKDKYDELLSDRFGAIYQSGHLLVNYADSIKSIDTTSSTIEVPQVQVSFDDTVFTFGGWNVDIIPDGFEFLVDVVKGAVDIACTFLFVNGMRKRYDNLVGGGSL